MWISMLKDRNDMTHIYNGAAAKELVQRILIKYIPEYKKLEEGIRLHYKDELDRIL
ncbi:nucleotidyltransferase substrate binding protein [Anaerolentibacter hominis]|uniref:nucleotidyltransferase substrate binding protein n=1 Tax=Anaerolentibacter hominis TaxID=3079009 RepID=UPI0031B89B9E